MKLKLTRPYCVGNSTSQNITYSVLSPVSRLVHGRNFQNLTAWVTGIPTTRQRTRTVPSSGWAVVLSSWTRTLASRTWMNSLRRAISSEYIIWPLTHNKPLSQLYSNQDFAIKLWLLNWFWKTAHNGFFLDFWSKSLVLLKYKLNTAKNITETKSERCFCEIIKLLLWG